MLGDTSNGHWVFRRNPTVTRAVDVFGGKTGDGIPYVAPEVLLLFKAKNRRPKAQQEFDAVASKLQPESREWLRAAIAATHPEHPWLTGL